MEYREFGKTGLKPSLLGFGCMRFPTKKDNEGNYVIDEVETEKMLDYAYSHGVTYYDTAYPYHNGKSEVVLGKLMKKYPRESFLVATKLPMWKLEKTEDVKTIFKEQLDRLQMEYVDFYLLHALNRDTFKKAKDLEVLKEVLDLKKEGKIRHIGFSFHDDYNTFEEIINFFDWEFCQIQFNYIDENEQAGLKGVKLTEEKGIPLVIMEPIKGGNLANFSEDVNNIFKSYNKDASIASWALRYVGSYENVKVILSGMTHFDQVEDNINVLGDFKYLNDEEKEVLKKAKEQIESKIKIGCTGCRYCMPCPRGVLIPRNFSLWNNYSMYNNPWFKKSYQDMNENEKATACIKCGKCEQACPQHLNIRESLVLLNEELSK